jgi:Icc-related predicted phosphoesterase
MRDDATTSTAHAVMDQVVLNTVMMIIVVIMNSLRAVLVLHATPSTKTKATNEERNRQVDLNYQGNLHKILHLLHTHQWSEYRDRADTN